MPADLALGVERRGSTMHRVGSDQHLADFFERMPVRIQNGIETFAVTEVSEHTRDVSRQLTIEDSDLPIRVRDQFVEELVQRMFVRDHHDLHRIHSRQPCTFYY